MNMVLFDIMKFILHQYFCEHNLRAFESQIQYKTQLVRWLFWFLDLIEFLEISVGRDFTSIQDLNLFIYLLIN